MTRMERRQTMRVEKYDTIDGTGRNDKDLEYEGGIIKRDLTMSRTLR